MQEQSGTDVVKTWKIGPKIECRRCGAELRYADRVRASTVLWASVAAFLVIFIAAITAWGSTGAIAVAIVAIAAVPIVMLNTEYKLAERGHDS
jgi:Flp pilus assembly protein TadB